MSAHYDQHQFGGKYQRLQPVDASTGIAFSDYDRMHTETHGENPRSWVPPFALNDKQLQRVLLMRGWRYVHSHEPLMKEVSINRDEINKLATAKALKGYAIGRHAALIQHEILESHKATVRRAGGFLELHAAIAFRAWRLGNSSTEVAESLGMTPWTVRQALWRLRQVAKQLGYDVGPAGHSAGTIRKKQNRGRRTLGGKS